MSEIKSAREIALEKVARLSKATEEERLRWKYASEGEKLAAKCLGEGRDLAPQLAGYEKKARRYVTGGAEAVLLAAIDLPRNEPEKRRNKRAMDAIIGFKSDKAAVMKVYNKMRHVFNTYTGYGEQQRKEAYQSLRAEWETRMKQAIAQQVGSAEGLEIAVDSLPQFQEEWQRRLVQLDSQYTELLKEYKQELKDIG